MRLTCLKCGHQVELATGGEPMRIECACGADYSYPDVRNTGVAPNDRAAERSRSKAFRAAGLVKNVGGFALGISLLGVLFFPLGIVGAFIGVYCLTMLRGPLGRYSGRRAAIIAIGLGVTVFVAEGMLALSWVSERRVRKMTVVQEQGVEDLKRLRRAERLFRATHDRYGTFRDFRFQPSHGRYTIYLGSADVFEADRDDTKIVDPLPAGYEPGVSPDDFTAVAVANLDSDGAFDIWVLTARSSPRHVADDRVLGDEDPVPPMPTDLTTKLDAVDGMTDRDSDAARGGPSDVAPPNADSVPTPQPVRTPAPPSTPKGGSGAQPPTQDAGTDASEVPDEVEPAAPPPANAPSGPPEPEEGTGGLDLFDE